MMLVYQALDLATEYYTGSILIVNAQNEWRASESNNNKKRGRCGVVKEKSFDGCNVVTEMYNTGVRKNRICVRGWEIMMLVK